MVCNLTPSNIFQHKCKCDRVKKFNSSTARYWKKLYYVKLFYSLGPQAQWGESLLSNSAVQG